MDERGANIDVLFRNGFKDYEVLPPPEIWDNIRPAIKNNKQPFVILRAAAMIAVVVSLSFLAYRISLQISQDSFSAGIVINPESEMPAMFAGNQAAAPEMQTPLAVLYNTDSPVPAVQIIMPDLFVNDTPEEPEIIATVKNDLPESNKVFALNGEMELPGDSYEDILIGDLNPLVYLPDNTGSDTKGKWSIAALVSPTYHTGFASGSSEFGGQIMSEEQPLMSYAGGVALAYKINRRISVQSGLYYSSFGNQLSGIRSFGGFRQYDNTKGDYNFRVQTTSGTIYTNNADVYLMDDVLAGRVITRFTEDVFDPSKADMQYLDNTLIQNFGYLELPFFVRYKLVDKTLGLNIIGGLSSNILVSNSVYASLDEGKYSIGKTEGINQMTFSSSLGMGMEYTINKNFSLNLEPTFRYYLNPLNEIPGMKFHPYSFGVFSGISYKF